MKRVYSSVSAVDKQTPLLEFPWYKAGIKKELKLIAESRGEEAIDSQIDELTADLEQLRDKIKAGRTRFQE